MTEPAKKHRKWWKFATAAGIVLGVACHAMPPAYRAPCQAASHVISVCTGQ